MNDDTIIESATAEEIMRARADYGSDNIQIDDGAAASRADGGTWVAAWVWVGDDGDELLCPGDESNLE